MCPTLMSASSACNARSGPTMCGGRGSTRRGISKRSPQTPAHGCECRLRRSAPLLEEAVMPYKHVLFEATAREKVLRGASAIADAVRGTLGPRSHSVLIETKWGAPIICNDGVTIAKEFALKDADENLGAQM